MKARILDDKAIVYGDMDLSAPLVMELVAGDEIDLGMVTKKGFKKWVEVTLPNGRHGYIQPETKIYTIRKANLLQSAVNVYEQPSSQSVMKNRYEKGVTFYLVDVVNKDGKDWVKIRDLAGNEGFIDGDTEVKVIPDSTQEAEKLPIAVHIMCGWPLILVAFGGAIGGGLGGFAYGINIGIYKSKMSLITKIALNIFVGLAAIGIWAFIAKEIFL
jgi:hypothetical protein